MCSSWFSRAGNDSSAVQEAVKRMEICLQTESIIFNEDMFAAVELSFLLLHGSDRSQVSAGIKQPFDCYLYLYYIYIIILNMNYSRLKMLKKTFHINRQVLCVHRSWLLEFYLAKSLVTVHS
ncbi:hypothetical protein GCK32_006339 [Trichostrongylus colubriformis]|uniref:Uncharacterized protein n=1 Tax=Trichostrongylus colubriformis TaxID=6319 RepID=A0AAN8IJA0_TRICO